MHTVSGRQRHLITVLLVLMIMSFIHVRVAHTALLVYVSNQASGDVTVLNTATNTIVTTIVPVPLCGGASGIAATPDNTHIYLSCLNTPTVYIIETATNTVVDTVSLPPGSRSQQIAFTPDGTKAYVVIQDSNAVGVIDTATNTLTRTIPGFNSPDEIVVLPNGSKAYVTNPGVAGSGSTVTVINVATDAVIGTIGVGQRPVGVAVTPDGDSVYVANSLSNSVSVIDPATDTLVTTIMSITAATNVAVTPDGTQAYIMGQAPSIIDTATNTIVGSTVANGNFIVFTPDGSTIYTVLRDNDEVRVTDAASDTIITILNPTTSPPYPGDNPIRLAVALVPSQLLDPVVLVHGWCGSPSEGTWGQMQSLLGGIGINADYADYGNDTEPDLARLAGRLSAEIDRVLQDTVLNPAGASQVDVVAHSMGGLVARALVANMAVDDAGNSIPYRNRIRKLIEIATPNYGVRFGDFGAAVSSIFFCNTDFGVRQQQEKQLQFGSHFLWVLHGRWSTTLLAQEQKSDVLTIVGTGNQLGGSDFVVPIESAALSDVGVRARYVDRRHFSIIGIRGIADVDGNHETFSLVKHFLLTGNDPPESECSLDECIRSLDPDTHGMLLFRLIDSKTRRGLNLRTSFVTTVDGVLVGGGSSIISAIRNTDPKASTFTIRPLAPSPPPHSVIVEPVTAPYHPGELNGIEIAPGRTTVFGELALERK